MSFGFINGAYNRASGTRNAFAALSADLVAEGFPPMVSRSGDREPDVQLRFWHERMTLTPGNRKVYGTKKWQGKTWYQIHPDTVAIPETSNHEKRRSNDLVAPYNADTTAARRAKVLAKKHNITREGENFRELWHWTFWGPLGTITNPAGGGASAPAPTDESEEDDMPRNSGITYPTPEGAAASQQTWNCLVFNTGSGFKSLITNGKGAGKFDGGYLTKRAKTFDTTDFLETSEGDAKRILESLAEVRTGNS